ncbi:chain-length determining protein [Bacteroides caecigallinarum]|uniref:Wzz/FepE/Etk N-terminal domain-containing protein n=1 Tax=Bacteroides caecigallinarum TaxID=1411144 RepID=UPI001F239B76|nr:Wzz/FepE/Etk N-terminal domain-containing protein [Bacteroides caecigallinarum]MCF2593699.1 chain-length determining protein [Bacteroides caecigallinarum]
MVEQEIDLLELGRKLWREKKLFAKTCGVAAVVGLIVGFSIPKEYTTTVTLAPESESGGKSASGGLSALAGLAGINIGSLQSADALSPAIYPDIVKSIPFSVEMLNVEVTDAKGEMKTTVYDYLKDDLKKPWWKHVMMAPGKLIGMITGGGKKDDADKENRKIDAFRLTPEQSGVVGELAKRVKVEEDKKTQLINISSTMQDPLISATVAKEVTEKLQDYITEYRTNKARMDLKYTQKLFDESQEKYHRLQQEYATYMDRNQNILLRSAQMHQERLKDEMQLAYNVYNQTAQQLQVAMAKVQESTPVCTVVEAATVPLMPAKPNKPLILIGFVFLAFVGTAGWVLMKKDMK